MGKLGYWAVSFVLHGLPVATMAYFGWEHSWKDAQFRISSGAGASASYAVTLARSDFDFAPAAVEEVDEPGAAMEPPEPLPAEMTPPSAPAADSTPSVESEEGAAEVYNPPPEYPPGARRQKLQGVVVVEVVVLADGACGDARIVEEGPYPSFGVSALAAVRQWKFQPATRAGVPVSSTQRIRFVFKLQS